MNTLYSVTESVEKFSYQDCIITPGLIQRATKQPTGDTTINQSAARMVI